MESKGVFRFRNSSTQASSQEAAKRAEVAAAEEAQRNASGMALTFSATKFNLLNLDLLQQLACLCFEHSNERKLDWGGARTYPMTWL